MAANRGNRQNAALSLSRQQIDRQGRSALCLSSVFFEQVLDRGEGGGTALEGFLESGTQSLLAVEAEQAFERSGEQGGVALPGEGGGEEG
jgi:hypothetical protein